jgi:hypothetical protein
MFTSPHGIPAHTDPRLYSHRPPMQASEYNDGRVQSFHWDSDGILAADCQHYDHPEHTISSPFYPRDEYYRYSSRTPSSHAQYYGSDSRSSTTLPYAPSAPPVSISFEHTPPAAAFNQLPTAPVSSSLSPHRYYGQSSHSQSSREFQQAPPKATIADFQNQFDHLISNINSRQTGILVGSVDPLAFPTVPPIARSSSHFPPHSPTKQFPPIVPPQMPSFAQLTPQLNNSSSMRASNRSYEHGTPFSYTPHALPVNLSALLQVPLIAPSTVSSVPPMHVPPAAPCALHPIWNPTAASQQDPLATARRSCHRLVVLHIFPTNGDGVSAIIARKSAYFIFEVAFH